MKDLDRDVLTNNILRHIGSDDFEFIAPELSRCEFRLKDDLVDAGQTISHVYFPESGYASVVTSGERDRAELTMIGREGVVGATLALGDPVAPFQTFVQAEGAAHRMTAEAFQAALARSEAFRALILRYCQVMLIQTSEALRTSARARLEERLARWLVMTHDRVNNDRLPVVHEFMALMLGVRRAGVTVALHELEGKGVVKGDRGVVTILDREGLAECANGYYGRSEREYARLIG